MRCADSADRGRAGAAACALAVDPCACHAPSSATSIGAAGEVEAGWSAGGQVASCWTGSSDTDSSVSVKHTIIHVGSACAEVAQRAGSVPPAVRHEVLKSQECDVDPPPPPALPFLSTVGLLAEPPFRPGDEDTPHRDGKNAPHEDPLAPHQVARCTMCGASRMSFRCSSCGLPVCSSRGCWSFFERECWSCTMPGHDPPRWHRLGI